MIILQVITTLISILALFASGLSIYFSYKWHNQDYAQKRKFALKSDYEAIIDYCEKLNSGNFYDRMKENTTKDTKELRLLPELFGKELAHKFETFKKSYSFKTNEFKAFIEELKEKYRQEFSK